MLFEHSAVKYKKNLKLFFYRIFNVNLKAVVNVSQVVAKRMVADKTGGSIVNVSSQVT